MKSFLLFVFSLMFFADSFSTVIIVDINGGGSFTNIQSAINASVNGDTVKVWPGEYYQQVNINKNIVLMGSGYENTLISSNFNPTITISTGIIEWFKITSSGGSGINIKGGLVTNCVVAGCSAEGILNNTNGSTGSVLNCIVIGCVNSGIKTSVSTATLNVTNCISRNNGTNGNFGFDGDYGDLNLLYSNGTRYYTNGNQGCIDQDPVFTSQTDFHISQGSPCWNTGSIALYDPDGSRSDMGYFGGPDCPIYPVVWEIIISPNGGSIMLEAKGRANY